MSPSQQQSELFSRPVRQAVTPLNAEAFSEDAKRLLHNNASAALHRGPVRVDVVESSVVRVNDFEVIGLVPPVRYVYGTQA